ncbi:MAG: DUF89 family protein [Desulfobulbaceae bacterium]|nr:DUF89 family protein [Desulfobulbaceae bacterium]
MKTNVDCLPCFLRQSLQVARLCGCSAEKQLQIVKEIAGMLPGIDNDNDPPANVDAIYRKIAELTGVDDPYNAKKKESNEQAKALLPELQNELKGVDDELSAVIRFVIAGNIIDYGAFETFDIHRSLEKSREAPLAVDHCSSLIKAISELKPKSTILYLTDNSGEIVYDSLLLSYLHRHGCTITIAVKDGPIINDALVEDALFAGLDRFGTIITNGTRCPGTVIDRCSDEFLHEFKTADLIISKGQGNFESLSEVDREIYFLLTIKCQVAARHMEELVGLEEHSLPGTGEMAVYFSGKNK